MRAGRPGPRPARVRQDDDPPTSITPKRSADRLRASYARCARSVVDDIDADPPPGLRLDGARADMRVLTLVMEYPDEPPVRPLLLLERRIETARFGPGGEKIDVTLAALFRRGLEPIRSVDRIRRGWGRRGWVRRP